jgi:hypothetical protein
MRPIHSDADLWEKVRIAPVMDNMPDRVVFSEKQIEQLYDLAVKCRNNSTSKRELITKLRGGDIQDLSWAA